MDWPQSQRGELPLQLLFATNQLVNAFRERYLSEDGRSVISIQPILSLLGLLLFLNKAGGNEFVEEIVQGTVVDIDRLFQFFGTHVAAVDE